MAFDPYELDRDYGAPSGVITEAQYTTRTFLWMMLGLMVTFGVAILGWVTNLTLYLYALIPAIPTVLAVATFILVVTFSRRIEKMSVASAQALFMGYSVLMGITLSFWLYLFQLTSVILIFLLTGLYFGALAALWPLYQPQPGRIQVDPAQRAYLPHPVWGAVSVHPRHDRL